MQGKRIVSWVVLSALLLNSALTLNAAPITEPSSASIVEPQLALDMPKTVQSPVFAQMEDLPHVDLRGPALYIILLDAPPVASYRGGIADLEATNPSVRGETKLDAQSAPSLVYTAYLETIQAQTLATMEDALGQSLTMAMSYQHALNGIVVELTPAQAAEIARLDGVQQVVRDFVRYPTTEYSVDWIGAPGIWDGSDTGGLPGTQGEGVIVGVIDTGINMDHPSFAAHGGDGYDHTNPFGAGNYVGLCDSQPGTYVCNDKLIGVWGFTTTGDPEDDDGHGSHTASTTAGNVVSATITAPTYTYSATIQGVAPHANIIAYDACISGQGCAGTALLASIDQTIIDGVDVINYSIGGGSTDPWNDTEALAFLSATDAGIIPVTSAGNDGPAASTVGSPADAPWMLSVGAVTHNREFRNALVSMSGGDTTPPTDITGGSVTGAYGPAPIVHAKDYDGIPEGEAGDGLCLTAFPAGTWTNGEIVVCDRGENARVEKAENVEAGGAVGFVLVNVDPAENWLANDMYVIPGVHIKLAEGAQLKAWLDSGSGHTATINGTWADVADANADIMGDFSSRGPDVSVPDLLKPDIAAPGVTVLAASMNGTEYETMGGTSMASPHIAGAATLLRALHPTWTPAQVKSALMLTAWSDTVLREDGVTPATPFDRGSGRVDLSVAAQAGLLMDETKANFTDADPGKGGDPKTLNLPSMADDDCYDICSWQRTVANALSGSHDWTVRVEDATPGLNITVSPSSFTLGDGATSQLLITADVTSFNVALDGDDGWGFAHIVLESPGQTPLHMPVAVKKNLTSDERLISKTASVTTTQVGQAYTYTVVLNNRDSVTNTYWLTDSLPAGVTFVPGSASQGMVYDAPNHQLTWTGEIGPGAVDYVVMTDTNHTYYNLGDGSSSEVCATYFPSDCDDVNLTIPLSSYNHSLTFYGEQLDEITLSSNSMFFGPEGWLGSACSACNQYLPEPTEINQVVAGLWRDINTTGGLGEIYVSILTGWLADSSDTVLYANWHDAAQYGNPSVTTRNAIAIVLDGQSEPAGRLYYVIEDTDGDLTDGYTIGAENKYGDRGTTHAYYPCDGGACIPGEPVGSIPANGTVLRLDPVLSGENYVVTLTYQVTATLPVTTLLTNEAVVTSNSEDANAQSMWARSDVEVTGGSPIPVWQKVVLHNGAPVDIHAPISLTSGDFITIVDQVNIAYTDTVTFALTETWGTAVALDSFQNDVGSVVTTGTTLTWSVAGLTPNTDYVLTKTFVAQGGIWLSDLLTESLYVQDATSQGQSTDKILTFVHGCEPVTGVDFDWAPAAPQPGDLVTITAWVDPVYADDPVTFDWTIGDRTPTGNPVYHTFAISDTYAVSVEANNACGGPVWMTHDIVVSGPPYVASPSVDWDVTTDAQSADPGTTVVYTLTLNNSGDTPDTYDLTVSGATWPVTITPAVADMMVGESIPVTVTTTIPADAPGGVAEVIDVSAVAQQYGVSAIQTLTTTANALYGLTLVPSSAADSALPSDAVTYTLWVMNTGNASDTFTVTLSGDTWTTTAPGSVGPVAAQMSTTLSVMVEVPADALAGDSDAVTVQLISVGDPAQTGASVLTTSADAFFDLTLVPTSDAQSADPGVVVQYTLHVTNTGNAADTFAVAVAGNTWTTTAPASTGSLAPGAGTDVNVSVTIPATALAGAADMCYVTLTSAHDVAVSASSTLTTTANAVAGFSLLPAAAAQSGAPGTLVTYTLTLTNEGNNADTYTLETTGVWTVTTPTSIGPVAAFDSALVTVTVAIPDGIGDGVLDTSTITATSQGTPALVATSMLTTTSLSAREYGIELTPAAAMQTAEPGDVVTYTLHITNSGNFTDSFTLAANGYAWTTVVPASVDDLAASEGVDVQAVVYVPADAANSAQDVVNIVAASVGNPAASAASTLTTTVLYTPTMVTLTVATAGTGTGAVEPAVGSYSYVLGTEVVLTATADAGSTFVGWLGDAAGTATSTSIVMDSHKTVTAVFNLEGVCVDVASVTLSQVTTGDIYTDTLVQFSAAISPTTAIPYTYTMDFGDGPSVPTTTLMTPMTWDHTFVTVGTHNVIFAAWNCTQTVPFTDTLAVEVLPQPTANVYVYLPLVMRTSQ